MMKRTDVIPCVGPTSLIIVQGAASAAPLGSSGYQLDEPGRTLGKFQAKWQKGATLLL